MSRPNEWTEQETKQARASMQLPPDDFFRLTGRTKQAARAHIRYVDHPELWEQRTNRKRRERRELGIPERLLTAKSGPPPEVIADAIKRALIPRSITALICGDPPFPAKPSNAAVLA